jgi:hypothetical protein
LTPINYNRGFNAGIDAVLNLLQTIDGSVYENSKDYKNDVWKQISQLKPDENATDLKYTKDGIHKEDAIQCNSGSTSRPL